MATATRPDVIGRDEELARLDRFISSLEAGPAALVIAGEAGIGKTTLWKAGVDLGVGDLLAVEERREGSGERRLREEGRGPLSARDVRP
jgi:hypothetical protein